MITLSQARRHLRDRIAEEGMEFWAEADVLRYLNLAQDFIASITRGVSEEVEEQVGVGQSSFPLPARTLNAHQLSGYDADHRGRLWASADASWAQDYYAANARFTL